MFYFWSTGPSPAVSITSYSLLFHLHDLRIYNCCQIVSLKSVCGPPQLPGLYIIECSSSSFSDHHSFVCLSCSPIQSNINLNHSTPCLFVGCMRFGEIFLSSELEMEGNWFMCGVTLLHKTHNDENCLILFLFYCDVLGF